MSVSLWDAWFCFLDAFVCYNKIFFFALLFSLLCSSLSSIPSKPRELTHTHISNTGGRWQGVPLMYPGCTLTPLQCDFHSLTHAGLGSTPLPVEFGLGLYIALANGAKSKCKQMGNFQTAG